MKRLAIALAVAVLFVLAAPAVQAKPVPPKCVKFNGQVYCLVIPQQSPLKGFSGGDPTY